jgi:multiple sugar transport system substrate-binding protein
MAARRLKIALVGGPMYDGLYSRIPLFTSRTGCQVEIGVKLIHPELNDHIAKVYADGRGDYDLIVTHNKYAPSQKQWLLPLNGHLNADEIGAFLPSTIALATMDGDLMGLPRNIDVRLLYYRRDLFEDRAVRSRFEREFGHALEVPRTWEEFGQAARCLAAPPGRYGTLYPGRFSGLFGTWYELMAMAGGRLLDANRQPAFTGKEGQWALGFLRDLHITWRTTPPNLPDLYYDDVAQYFCQGKAAMVTDWPGGYHRYCDPKLSVVADRFDVALYPTGPAGLRRVYAGIFMFAIPRSVHDLPAALDLLRFLTDEENQVLEARQGVLAVRPAVQKRMEAEAKAGSREARRLQYLAETAKNSMLEVPKTPWYPRLEDTLWQAVQSGITGSRSVEEALHAVARQVQEIIRKGTPT